MQLLLDLPSNDPLEVSDDGREGVGTDSRTDTVMSGLQVGDPFSHGFVDGILQGLRTRGDGDDLGAETEIWVSFVIRLALVVIARLTCPPNILILNTFRACLRTSSAPMYTIHSIPNLAQAVAVATPC